MLHFKHQYEEVDRYLMFNNNDHVFYECKICGKQKEEFTLDTYFGKANAPSCKEWYDNRLRKEIEKNRIKFNWKSPEESRKEMDEIFQQMNQRIESSKNKLMQDVEETLRISREKELKETLEMFEKYKPN